MVTDWLIAALLGTGYGHGKGSGEVWDAKAALAAQEAQDAQLQQLLQDLQTSLAVALGGTVTVLNTAGQQGKNTRNLERAGLGVFVGIGDKRSTRRTSPIDPGTPPTGEGVNAAAGAAATTQPVTAAPNRAGARPANVVATRASSRAAAKSTPAIDVETEASQQLAAQRITSPVQNSPQPALLQPSAEEAAALACIQDSVLLPFLSLELNRVALTEMMTRCHYYTPLLEVCRELCRPTTLDLLLHDTTSCAAGHGITPRGGSNNIHSSQGVDSISEGSVAAAIHSMVSSARVYSTLVQSTLDTQRTQAGAAASSSSSSSGSSAAAAAKEAGRL